MRYKEIIIIAGLLMMGLLSVGLLGARGAYADNGPHVAEAGSTPDKCAGCHRIHTGQNENLLSSAIPAMCLSCHDSTGADTDVVHGLLASVPGKGLMGGGFSTALMDTDWDGASASTAVTSTHTMDGTTGTLWGNGAIGSGVGATNFTISCISCHNPHGGAGTDGAATYRILRPIPLGSGAAAGVEVPEQDPKDYGVEDPDNKYFGQYYEWERDDALADWCSQCHTRYLATADSGHTHSGDPIYSYRHMTQGWSSDPDGCLRCHFIDGQSSPPNPYGIDPSIIMDPRCQTCHVAHGTSTTMGTFSGSVPYPDGSQSATDNERSSLLRLNNRGVCRMCHADK